MLRVIHRYAHALTTFVAFAATVTVVTLVTFSLAISAYAANIFGPPGLQPVNIGGGVGSPGLAVTADFNNDGYPDLAVLNYNSANGNTNLAIFTSNAIGTLTLTHDYGVFNFVNARDIVAADVNGDGKIDLVVSDNSGVSILLGTGDPSASFAAASPQRPYQPDTVGTTFRAFVADLNNDGKPDLITESSYGSGSYVEVLFGIGGGKFEFAIQYDVGYGHMVGLAKVDNDSFLDLVLRGGIQGDDNIYVMKGVGNGLFLPAAVAFNYLSTIKLLDVVRVADLDGDGKVDVIMQNLVGKGVWMAKGNGDGTFQAPTQLFATGINPCCNRGMGVFQIADVNGDGRLDIVSDGYVALQQANHSFVINEHIGYPETYMLAALDLNGDGRADIITAGPNAWDTRIAVFMSVAGAATNVFITGGPQSTPFNTAFANPLTVTVKDSKNVAVSGLQVSFSASPGVATATLFAGTTDAQGKMSYTPTANGGLGCYQLTATIATVAFKPFFDLCNTGANTLTVLAASNNQTTLVNTAFGNVLQVQLKNSSNVAVPGVTVSFSKPANGASAALAPTSGTTDGSGVIFVNATANGVAGAYQLLVSAPGTTPTTIKLNNSAPANAAAALAVDVNTPQYGYVTKPFSSPIIIHVTDFFNNPVAGVTVNFALTPDPATSATATFSALTAVTNAQGNAQVTATANGFVGQYSMKVTLPSNPFAAPKSFALKNVASLPKFMALTSGSAQSTPVNTAFTQKLRVKVTDSLNAVTPQVRVYFSASNNAGANATLTPSSALADATGFAEVTATANGVVGSYQIGAIVFDTSTELPITQLFNLTNLAAVIPDFFLTVTKSGAGTGTVTGTGITCGADCSETLAQNTVVVLTAAPSAGSTFAGWTGAGCIGTGTCSVTMSAAQTVNAQFDLIPAATFLLTATKSGTGSGTVSATGIACGADCNEIYAQNTLVALTAAPAAGSTFAGWSGAGCSGTGTCIVAMSAAQTVNAQFDAAPPPPPPPPVATVAVPTLDPVLLALLAVLMMGAAVFTAARRP